MRPFCASLPLREVTWSRGMQECVQVVVDSSVPALVVAGTFAIWGKKESCEERCGGRRVEVAARAFCRHCARRACARFRSGLANRMSRWPERAGGPSERRHRRRRRSAKSHDSEQKGC